MSLIIKGVKMPDGIDGHFLVFESNDDIQQRTEATPVLSLSDIFKNSSIKTWKPGEPLREEDFLEKEETTNECADQRG